MSDMIADEPTSMVVVRIGDRDYPAKTSDTCRTCQHPKRAKIESWFLHGYRWKAILKEIGDEESALGPLTEKALRWHCLHHLPIEAAAQTAILERRAAQIGDAIAEHGDRVNDSTAAVEMIISKGFDRVVAGEIKIEVPDLLKAIETKKKLDESVGDGADLESWRTAMMVHMQKALEFIPPELHRAFARSLAEHPILRALADGQKPQPRALQP